MEEEKRVTAEVSVLGSVVCISSDEYKDLLKAGTVAGIIAEIVKANDRYDGYPIIKNLLSCLGYIEKEETKNE